MHSTILINKNIELLSAYAGFSEIQSAYPLGGQGLVNNYIHSLLAEETWPESKPHPLEGHRFEYFSSQ